VLSTGDYSIAWSILLTLSSIISLYISGYAFQRKYVNGALELSFFLLMAALFMISGILEVNGFYLFRILFFARAGFFFATFTVPAFFLFTLKYYKDRDLHPGLYPLFLILSFAIGFAGLFLRSGSLLYREFWLEDRHSVPSFHYRGGILYYIQLAYLISLSMASQLLLLLKVFKSRGKVRKQSLFVFLGSLVPFINILIFPERIAGGFDSQPLALGVMGCFIGISLFRYRMLDLIQAAREKAVDNMGDGLLVIDHSGLVLDINRKGRELPLLEGFTLGRIYPGETRFGTYLSGFIGRGRDRFDPDRALFREGGRVFRIFMSSLSEGRGKGKSGYLIIIHDTTEMVNLVSDLEHHARIDSLTGIYNRRHWMNLVRKEWDTAVLNKSALVLIIFDLDHFKRINDTYGHVFGDEVLRTVADRVREILRKTEILGRYGGEEFCLYCAVEDREQAYAIGERVRECVESLNMSREGVPVRLTTSVGVCFGCPDGEERLDSYLQKADEALYRAKGAGRNMTVLYGDGEAGS